MKAELHSGHVMRRPGSGSKWERVKCACGWSRTAYGGTPKRAFEAMWRAHIREIGGKPPPADRGIGWPGVMVEVVTST